CCCIRAEHRFAHGDLLFDHFGLTPLITGAVARGVSRVELFYIEILYIGHQVSRSPGYMLVVANDDTGSTYQRDTGYVIAAVGDAQMHLMPDGGQRKPLMGVAG